MLRLLDTATGVAVPPAERAGARVGLYVCGATVYGPPHIGHGRFALVYDVLRRYLARSGYDVRHVSNITDVDDKVIDRAAAEGRDWREVAEEAEEQWWAAMDAMGVLRPHEVPHATDYVEEMVSLVAELVRLGVAYETSDGVYLACDAVEGYGTLAHQSLDSLRSGARAVVGEEKRSPLDFAVWKKAKPGEPTWPSPFGPGRPGWHTECVVMSLSLLGEGFELHGGGLDLVFPHHENERAQAVALGRPFARHWVHNGLVVVGGEKMSKSLGNYTELKTLLDAYDPRAYRLLVLRSYYRSPLEVGPSTLGDAAAALQRVDELARRLEAVRPRQDTVPRGWDAPGGQSRPAAVFPAAQSLRGRFVEAMDDDLGTPRALAEVLGAVREANRLLDAGEATGALALGDVALELLGVLGIEPAGVEAPPATIVELAGRRESARRAGDYDAADRLRDELAAQGWKVDDLPDGPRLHR
jgi:cysteinyl-tRNA synthetase